MENYLNLFISELEEYTKQINKQLLKLEQNNRDSLSIIEVFRIFHTIKGMAQTMGFDALADISHRIEDLLDEAKKQESVSAQFVDFLFDVADLLSKYASALRSKEELPPTAEIAEAIARLKKGETLRQTGEIRRTEELGEIRIKLGKLDTLFNMTNELTIARSRLLKLSQEIDEPRLNALGEIASRLITSLQDEVMKLRMLPLSTVFEFFPRWLRDEAKRQDKDVTLDIIGGDIEVDRSIIEILKEPLMHLLRNALDHGIEKKQHAKKERSRIVLTAERERERINISVADNGKGIDLVEVRTKAIEQGLITEKQPVSDDEILRLLTHPAFSTKSEVSEISGRGIGLDIVNSAVIKLGGKLDISSKPNVGSCFTLELPISLAVVRVMVFGLDGQRFALPLNYIKETFYVDDTILQTVYHRELFPLRDEVLSIVRLSDYLGGNGKKGRKSVIVVQMQDKRRGFVTDNIIDEEEIVVKKLDPLLAIPYYSGCSIYADGLPILILDPRGFG